MFQEYKLQNKDLSSQDKFQMPVFESKNENHVEVYITEPSVPLSVNASYSHYWIDYVAKLGRVLCSFLLAPEDNKFHVQVSAGRNAMPVSAVYGELSIKWVMRVLLTVFPCIKACSNQNELPGHLR